MNGRKLFALFVLLFSGAAVMVLIGRCRSFSPLLFFLLLATALFGGAVVWYVLGFFGQKRAKVAATAPPLQLWPLSSLFIFNTLHNIAALTAIDPEKARATIERLAELLRNLNDLSKHETTLLTQEIRCAELFLSVEQARLGERLIVSKNIDPECLEEQLPSFLLLPLVENAVRYSVEVSHQPVQLCLRAYYRQKRLVIELSHNSNATSVDHEGKSSPLTAVLTKLHPILRQYYGNGYELKGMELSPSGYMVRLQLPPRTAPGRI